MRRSALIIVGVLFAAAAFTSAVPAQKLKAEDVVAKHLDAIGTAEARAAEKSRMAVGDATVTFISQKNVGAQGV